MKFRRNRPADVDVNLTPLIDVVFLLLIFFMVTTTFTKETHLAVELPEADGLVAEAPLDILEVVVNEAGSYSVNGLALINSQADTLRRALLKAAGDNRALPFVVTADANTPHQAVVTVMDVAGKMGFSSLSITTQKPPAEQ